ncbi:nucleoside triphosphate pyrophosphohydrolase, partial [Bdellovibrionota bacterium FG-2]
TQTQYHTKQKMKHKPPAIETVQETVHMLRAPGGCPWDKAQTHQSLRPCLVEEAYEVIDVIDNIHSAEDLKNPTVCANFKEELGDLLMQVLIHSEIAEEEGAFNFNDVAQGLNGKLIRRHPHVFGDVKADSADSALKTWEKQKAQEKDKISRESSVLDGVPKGLPALSRAARVVEKATKVGFQWKDLEGPLLKLEEELAELKVEIHNAQNGNPGKLAHEFGDVFFSLCNLAYLMKVNPEDSLRTMLTRFESRFRHVERGIKAQGKNLEDSTLEEMDKFWNEAKELEKTPTIFGLTGGIASGKSTAARLFEKQGIPVIDADSIARELAALGGAAHDAIVARFGTADRGELRKIVFADSKARSDLEAILHPLIAQESEKRFKNVISKSATRPPFLLYEASLLVETGRYRELTGLILVEAPREVRRSRVMDRDQISRELAEQIIEAQASDEVRRKAATFVLDNAGSTEELEKRIQEMISRVSLYKR